MKKILSHFSLHLIFAVLLFSFLFLSRVSYMLIYHQRIDSLEMIGKVLMYGMKFDSMILSYILAIPIFLSVIAFKRTLRLTGKFISLYYIFFLLFVIFIELCTIPFINEYDTRPNRIAIEYLIYPKELLSMLAKGFWMEAVLAFSVLGVCIYFIKRNYKKLPAFTNIHWVSKLVVYPIILFFLFWGARGNLTKPRPDNPSVAAFSNDQLVNALGLNSFYTILYAAQGLQGEENVSKMYGEFPLDESYQRVKKLMAVQETDFSGEKYSLVHKQKSVSPRSKPCNIVIFLQESLGAEYTGCLGNSKLTPMLDSLANLGLLYTNMYSTGTRSVRGIEAVFTGFMPTPSREVVKLGKSQQNFFSIAALLKGIGFETSFIYGGMSNFDNMGSFFSGNGIRQIIDETDYESPVFKSTWGVSDEDLVQKAHETYLSYGDKPFFSLIFSSSNHVPFEFPDGRIQLFEQPKNTVNNAIKYADYAIGKFFRLARSADYYDHTVFVVVADHNTRVYGDMLVPVHKFHIPAVVVAPGINNSKYTKLCSQLDLVPTLLDLAGVDCEIPAFGHDLVQLADSVPGRSFMQFYSSFAYRVENKMIVLQPGSVFKQFELSADGQAIEQAIDREFLNDARAYQVVASHQYQKMLYRVK
ncbi:MAG: hypothetical protein A2W90_03615 [Bacteroidetes bacterium GWF2_42_66]|nr:MAG: hypothetical protein A2W92_18535 [Bacteroidetes bacterium GWA2_42_15]OFY02581.1 MAG: hypothetical protein A2W89_22235 [Bacteroidetes bacterium GWE2_42_39]OFY41319.1 MAG: hypothetical protein A2W90_03615 [Bacteroidetes bacterium GWF2_42_66]HAZ04954.1 sulfatase [Marinilabiliales bacterium]HBL75485.1 sulfatase [Prolixibacteraceae bacterium]